MDDTLLGIIVIIFIMCGTTIISIINIFRNGLKYGELEKNFKKLEKENIEIKKDNEVSLIRAKKIF